MVTGPTKFNVRQAKQLFSRQTDDRHIFQFQRFTVRVMEMEDINFHHDSAVLLPDYDTEDPNPDMPQQERVTSFAVLAEALRHAERNQSERLLVAGHTDTSGPPNYNVNLSELRAEGTVAALMGDRATWVRVAEAKHKVEDFQLILKWINRDWGVDGTDPGPIDNVNNPQTRAAVKKFQEFFNSEFNRAIATDGNVGTETWGAFFDVYMVELREILDIDDDAGMVAIRSKVQFVDGSRRSVGCGENFPVEARGIDGLRSLTNRRVEFNFFQTGQEPLLNCQPRRGQCIASQCEVNNPRIFVPTLLPVPPVLPRRIRLNVHLQFAYSDPQQVEHLLPKDFPLIFEFGGNPADVQRKKLEENGIIKFSVDRRKQSFTVKFDFSDAANVTPTGVHYLGNITPGTPAGQASDQLIAEPNLPAALQNKLRVFELPLQFSIQNSDWHEATVAGALRTDFTNLQDTTTTVGTSAAPLKLVLDPHWMHFKMLYFDRRLKQKLSILPVVMEGFFKPAGGQAAPTDQRIRSNWTTTPQACQCMPWILRKGPTGNAIANPDQNVLLQLRSNARTFIDSSSNAADTRTLVTKQTAAGASPAATDPGIAEGTASAVNFDVPNAARLDFYDLPAVWRSRNFFCRLSGGAGQPATAEGTFQTLANRATTDALPLLFSLDDIVLTDAALNPIAFNSATDRVAIFHHKFVMDPANPNLGPLGLFKPDATDPFFSQKVQMTQTTNYIGDYPDWTRLVITQGNIFDCFDQRTGTAATVVGARAGVRNVDATAAGNFVQNPNSMSPRPTTTQRPFCAVNPFFEIHHLRGTHVASAREETIGRFDLIALRCCDANGTTEIGLCMNYFRHFFNFSGVTTGPLLTPAGQKSYINSTIQNIPNRWNGPDPNPGSADPTAPAIASYSTGVTPNPGRAIIRPQAAPQNLDFQAVYFAQAFPNKNIAHFQLDVVNGGRAFMGGTRGNGQLGDFDNQAFLVAANPPNPGFPISTFTAAHENGHGDGLNDEYVETAFSASYDLNGVYSNIDGGPYIADNFSLMCFDMSGITPRYFWHMAEWLFWVYGTEMQVVHSGFNFNLPHHPRMLPRALTRPPIFHFNNWPMANRTFASGSNRGAFDVFIHPLSQEAYGRSRLAPGRAPFDGIIMVLVKMRFTIHTTVHNQIRSLLRQLNSNTLSTFNGANRFIGAGTVTLPADSAGVVRQHTFNRALIFFQPRYLVNTFSGNAAYAASVGVANTNAAYTARVNAIAGFHPTPFNVTTRASGGSSWSGTSRNLTFDASAPGTFPNFFADMVGVPVAGLATAANYLHIVQQVIPGGTVAAA